MHPLKCPDCQDYRELTYIGVRSENDLATKGVGINIPFFVCANCGKREPQVREKDVRDYTNKVLEELKDGEYVSISIGDIYPQLAENRRFNHFDHLDLNYDSRDYYLIPGVYRDHDDGFLTPVFFDKDVLLYYNNHPDYRVELSSLSSGTIYYKDEPLLSHGFGINRAGKLFRWLGDLDADFGSKEMKPHLRRFQASNVSSDHDIVSKYYLSQCFFEIEDAFYESDNEALIFDLCNRLANIFKKEQGLELTKLDIENLSEYFKPPILEERNQIFNAYLSLNKYLIENLQAVNIRSVLTKLGVNESELEKDGRKVGSIKLFQLTIQHVFKKTNAAEIVSPLFVLYDLRQLHGHLHDTSFIERYDSCKARLGLDVTVTDMVVYNALVEKLIELYQMIAPEVKD